MGIPALESISKISNLLKEINDIPLKQEIINLQNQVMMMIDDSIQLRNEKQELNDKIVTLQNEIASLNKQNDLESDLNFVTTTRIRRKSDNDNSRSVTFYCRYCWDKERKLFALPSFGMSIGPLTCPNCKNKC